MPYEAHCTNCGRFTLDNDTIGSNLSGHPFPLVFRSLPIKLCSSVIPVNKATRALGYHTFHLVVVFHENRNKFLTKYCLQIYQSLIALTTLVENKTLLHDTFIPKNKNKLNALVLWRSGWESRFDVVVPFTPFIFDSWSWSWTLKNSSSTLSLSFSLSLSQWQQFYDPLNWPPQLMLNCAKTEDSRWKNTAD